MRWRRKPKTSTEGNNPSQPNHSTPRKAFPSGIKPLHCPPGSTVDIVFIHGLTGDRERTWTAKNASEPWPKTLLAPKLPTARILTFGYDAYVTNWRHVVSQNQIANHANNLLNCLAHYREGDNTDEHPIIFVCHSLGGLVCQDALTKARQRTEQQYQRIFRSVQGILFLGTPHHGAGLAVWAERLSKYIDVFKQTNSKIVEVLRADSGVLARIQDAFHTMVRARTQEGLQPIEISCFYEELPLTGLGYVVPQHSAIIPGYIQIGIHQNHMDMCRFDTANDPGFESIYGELRRRLKQIGETGASQDIPSAPDTTGASQISSVGRYKGKNPVAQFIVPYPSNPQFVGRSEVLAQLQSRLGHQEPHMDNHSHRRMALYGLGGIGKTQIALAYVFWLHETSPDVPIFWVHASNIDRFRQAYTEIAEECQVPGYDDPKADILSLLKKWLERKNHGRWFMVIDNADDAQLFCQASGVTNSDGQKYLGKYIPECAHGAVLITTRNKQVGLHLTKGLGLGLHEIGKMDVVECRQLLRASLDDNTIATEELSTLASRLEHLPLALAQASAFIQENTITVEHYLRLLDQGDKKLTSLLSEEFTTVGRDSDTPHALAATWIISFEQIEKLKPLATELLLLMSLFDRQAIPMEFLDDFIEYYSDYSQRKDLELTKALGILKAYSLIAEETDHSFNMHRLVQLVAQKWLAMKGTMRQYAEKAIRTVADCYPYGEFETREKCIAYLPHVQAVLHLDGLMSEDGNLARASIIHNTAGLLSFQGQWALAEKFSTHAMEILREILGPSHPNTLSSMQTLAAAYWDQGRWKEAEVLDVQVLETRKAIFGPGHPDTLAGMNNLALTYRSQGRWKEAEMLQVQVLETLKAILGPDHLDTLTDMNNLASTYWYQGRWKEAEVLQVQVLETRKAILGPDHPDTLVSMSSLASTYYDQGRRKEAEVLEVQVLKTRKAIFGPDHPDTLAGMSNLASTYSNQGRWEEAEVLQVQVLETRKALLRPDHPVTLISMNNLAHTWKSQGREHEALQLMEECMQARQRVLGEDHPDTVDSLSALGDWRAEQKEAGSRSDSDE